MNPKFAAVVEALEARFEALMQMPPLKAESLPKILTKRGIYLFPDGPEHLYVGRSDDIRRRIRLHCYGQHNQATFAFRMARKETGNLKAAYTQKGSRSQLVLDPVFGPMFTDCKARIRKLDLRFVEEPDPTRQALLEIYTATVLETPFNDFRNS
jgi:hypothetical protein